MKLYRGVNQALHLSGRGLCPKQPGGFGTGYGFNEGMYNSFTPGVSAVNAVSKHQFDSSRFPSSGVSTTPLFDRAKIYAKGPKGDSSGVVYEIDRQKCSDLSIQEFEVARYVGSPSVPEDQEVILVGSNGGPLPSDIISRVIDVP